MRCIAASLLSLVFLLAGCYTVRLNRPRLCKTIVSPGHSQVTAVSVSRIRPKLVNEGLRYKFELVADGEFVVHHGNRIIKRDVGVPSVAIGMFPGCAAPKRAGSSSEYLLATVVAQATLLLGPTFWALFCEPFADYTEDAYLLRVALLGCCKYYTGIGEVPDSYSFGETSRETVEETSLWGYDVLVNGKAYHVQDGAVYLDGVKRGDVLKIEILTAPLLRLDSSDHLSDLVGLSMDAVCP